MHRAPGDMVPIKHPNHVVDNETPTIYRFGNFRYGTQKKKKTIVVMTEMSVE